MKQRIAFLLLCIFISQLTFACIGNDVTNNGSRYEMVIHAEQDSAEMKFETKDFLPLAVILPADAPKVSSIFPLLAAPNLPESVFSKPSVPPDVILLNL